MQNSHQMSHYQFQELLDICWNLAQLCPVETYPPEVVHLHGLPRQSTILKRMGSKNASGINHSHNNNDEKTDHQVIAREVHSPYEWQHGGGGHGESRKESSCY